MAVFLSTETSPYVPVGGDATSDAQELVHRMSGPVREGAMRAGSSSRVDSGRSGGVRGTEERMHSLAP